MRSDQREKKISSRVYANTDISIALIMEQMDFLVGYDSTFERWTKRNDRREKESVTKIDKHTHTQMKIYPKIYNCTRSQYPLLLSLFRVYHVSFYSTGE